MKVLLKQSYFTYFSSRCFQAHALFAGVTIHIFYSSVVVMLILPVLIILRYTLRHYTILILAGASHVPVIVIGEHFFNFCIISPKNLEMRRSTFVVI